MAEPLHVTGLDVSYRSPAGRVLAVRDVDLHVARATTVGVVGESGCGKTTLSRAVTGLLPRSARVDGSIEVFGTEVVGLGERDWRRLRARVAYVPQSAMSGLNPVLRIGDQIAESIRLHRTDTDGDDDGDSDVDVDGDPGRRGTAGVDEQVGAWLERVGLDPARARDYPHEFSGGMRQRAVIAMMLAARPGLIVADEPTVGLDVVVQRRLLETLAELRATTSAAMIVVSHDLAAVAPYCDHLVVMYAGRIVEQGPCDEVLRDPQHPYTAGLVAAVPTVDGRWGQIPGPTPDPAAAPAGCAFHPRCPHRLPICTTATPTLREPVGAPAGSTSVVRVACHLHDRDTLPSPLAAFPQLPPRTTTPLADTSTSNDPSDMQPLDPARVLEIVGLTKTFHVRRGWHRTSIRAVDGVDLAVARGEVVGLLGRSGSGKSTIARCIVGLERPDAGTITVDGTPVATTGRAQRRHRRRIGMVAQDAYDALHPGMRVADLVAEPLRIAGERDVAPRVADALAAVGLPSDATMLRRFAGELSGGQRQRVVIARALVPRPALLLADEPTSMLDVSLRAGIAGLLRDLCDEYGLGVLLVTHHIAEAIHVCDRLVVLEGGRVVDDGPAAEVVERAAAPATRELIDAARIESLPGRDPTTAQVTRAMDARARDLRQDS